MNLNKNVLQKIATGAGDDVPVRDELGGGVTASCSSHHVLYRLDGEVIAMIERRDSRIDLVAANGLDAPALLRRIRCLMFALERQMQLEYARGNPLAAEPHILSFGNEVIL